MEAAGRDDAEERRRVIELALPAIQRYFPYTVGTLWVYKRGDGKLETRRVTALTPTQDGNFKITLRVTEEGEYGESYDTHAFVVGRVDGRERFVQLTRRFLRGRSRCRRR